MAAATAVVGLGLLALARDRQPTVRQRCTFRTNPRAGVRPRYDPRTPRRTRIYNLILQMGPSIPGRVPCRMMTPYCDGGNRLWSFSPSEKEPASAGSSVPSVSDGETDTPHCTHTHMAQ